MRGKPYLYLNLVIDFIPKARPPLFGLELYNYEKNPFITGHLAIIIFNI